MINQPDVEILKSLARLTHNDDFKTMIEWLESELIRISEQNDLSNDIISLRRGQGAVSVLRQLLFIHSDAEKALNKIKR